MERSGHRGRRDIPLGMVVKVCFYTILIDILCTLFRFIFRIVNVLLAGLSGICLRLQNLREYAEIEIGPKHFPTIDDFKDDSANLIDPNDTKGTSSSESDDDSPIPFSSEVIGAHIAAESSEDVDDKEIGHEQSSLFGDFNNLIDPHDSADTSSSESDDDSPIPFSEVIGAHIAAEGSEDVDDKEIGHEKSSLFGGDLNNSALRVLQNVMDSNLLEMKDNATSSASSETNVAGAPEEDLTEDPVDDPEKKEESEVNPTIKPGNMSTLYNFVCSFVHII